MSAKKKRETKPDPRVVVCAGGGGVGKTTTSAALALALARRGTSTLIVTIDPARRLAGAMGVPITDRVCQVSLPGAGDKLAALMPDPKRSLRTFIDDLFEDEPEARERLLRNRLYLGLSDAAAGVHELVAMNLVARAAEQFTFDVIVIDTAPSRHAIDFVTYPGRLAALLGGRTVGWLAGLAERAGTTQEEPQKRGIVAWSKGHVEGALAKVTGPNLVGDTAVVFTELARVRERFVAQTKHASDLLLGDTSAYVLVAAPTAAARDDVLYLVKRVRDLGRGPTAVVMNRADAGPPPYVLALSRAASIPASIREAIQMLDDERSSRATAADAFAGELQRALPKVPIARLPFIEARSPDRIVMELSRAIEPHLGALSL